MFKMMINNGSLDKAKIQNLNYPGASPEVHGIVTVPAIISSDGTPMFEVCDIVSKINKYTVLPAIRTAVVKCLQGCRYAFGTVVIHRRGGIYADTQALSYIVRRFFGDGGDTTNIRKVADTALLYLVKKAPEATNMSSADAAVKIKLFDYTEIYPGTLKITKDGVYGKPCEHSELVEGCESADQPAAEASPDTAEDPKEEALEKPTVAAAEETLSITDLGALSSVIQALLKGRSLSVNITVKID